MTKTPVTLSVKERVAEGLSRAGASNTLKVVSYNSILGTIAYLSSGAIRQFCTFALVVLVAHWFLAHTFFLAVLSIDIQRLEVSYFPLYSLKIDPLSSWANSCAKIPVSLLSLLQHSVILSLHPLHHGGSGPHIIPRIFSKVELLKTLACC